MKNFDYNTDIERYLNALTTLESELKTIGIDMCIYAGTLLGAVRENDFIKHDDDIDVSIISSKSSFKKALDEFKTQITPYLEGCGYTVLPIKWTSRGEHMTMLGQYHITRGDILIDLWLGVFEDDKLILSHKYYKELSKTDILPYKKIKLRDREYNAPKNTDLFLDTFYGTDWEIPKKGFKTKNHDYFIDKNILRIIDQYGWAYYFTSKEQQKYSIYSTDYIQLEEFLEQPKSKNYNIIYMPGPCMGTLKVEEALRKIQKDYDCTTRVIGAYSGNIEQVQYQHGTLIDLMMPISIRDIDRLKELHPHNLTTFLPESVDTKFFVPGTFPSEFTVGWSGSISKDKRSYLFNQLVFPIVQKKDWGNQFFTKDRSSQPMLEYYQSLSCLILPSKHECMSRTILEAMACGLPVIGTDVGSIRYCIDPEWIIPNGGDIEIITELNKKLSLLASNPKLCKEVGKRNRKRVEEYLSWDKNQRIWDATFTALYNNPINNKEIEKISNDYLASINYPLPEVKKEIEVNKIIDVYGWAYYFVFKEQQKYTKLNLKCNTIEEVSPKVDIIKNEKLVGDVVYFHSPGMSQVRVVNTVNRIRKVFPNTKIIGAYGGESVLIYPDCDLVLSISIKYVEELRKMYPNKTIIYLPEAVDTEYFTQNKFNNKRFNPGWAGGRRKVKRTHLLDKLDYTVLRQHDDKEESCVESRTLDAMKKFYNTVDVLLITSKSECMPRVVLEAMSSGLPIVSTDVGSMRLLIESEWIVPVESEDMMLKEMNRKLKILKNNPKLRKEVGERNRKHIEQYFSWKTIQPLWDSVFENLYNNNYENIVKLSNNYILQFKDILDINKYLSKVYIEPKLVTPICPVASVAPVAPVSKETSTVTQFVNLLVDKNISFWLLSESCLDFLKYKKFIKNILNIGVPNIQTKEIINTIFNNQNNSFNLDITVENNRRTKEHSVNELTLKVPVPVVLYLEQLYKTPFEELMRIK